MAGNETEEYEAKQITAETMLHDFSRKTEKLDGEWHYAYDQYGTFLRDRWYEEQYRDSAGNTLPVEYSYDDWPCMRLPSCWNRAERELKLYEGSMVFTRTFSYRREQEKERVILKVGAANYLCRVFLNGEYLGMHRGGSTPFYLELTGHLKETNRIILQVDNTRRPDQVPTVNTDWFNYGGVYRGIELLRLPETYIQKFQIALVPDGTFSKIMVRAELSSSADAEAKLSIPGLSCEETFSIHDGKGELVFPAKPDLWSPEHPKLYDVCLACGDDTVRDRVGFREIRVEGREILLNGEKMFLRGICCHEDSAANGKALTEEERLENLRIAKELGCNFMRLAHYPHHENTARLADQLGILLWEEIPVYWEIAFGNEKTYQDAQNQLKELIRRDWNRASVIIWSVGNENPDTDERFAFMSRLADTAHREDPTRLVSAACLVSEEKKAIADRLIASLDVIGQNEYYGWYVPDFDELLEVLNNSAPSKPVIITECGADAMPGHYGTITDKGSEECQEEIYRKQCETIRKTPFIKGMTPWILYDFRCPRRTSVLQQYYNRKGLLDPEKKHRKKAFYVLQEFYRGMERE